jgi:hypothetical protein
MLVSFLFLKKSYLKQQMCVWAQIFSLSCPGRRNRSQSLAGLRQNERLYLKSNEVQKELGGIVDWLASKQQGHDFSI